MKVFLNFVKELYAYSKSQLLLNVLFMLISGLMSGFGVVMLIPLLSLTGIVGTSTIKWSFLDSFLIFFSTYEKSVQLLLVLTIYTLVIILQALVNQKQRILNTRIIQGYTKYLRVSLYEKTLKADWACLMEKKNSDITNAFSLEINRVAAGTIYLLQIISQSILAFFQLSVSFVMSPILTVVVLICGSIIFLYLNSSLKESKKLGSSLQKINQELFSSVTEQLNGVKEVKSYGIENSQLVSFNQTAERIEKNMLDFVKVQSKPDLYYKIGAALAISLFFFCAVNFLKVEPAALLIIIFIFSRLWPLFSSFQNNLQNIFVMLPSFVSLKNLETEFADNAEKIIQQEGKGNPLNIKDSICFERINFRYKNNSDNFEIKDINLQIKAKTIVALVGHSGCGKSTIVDLLLGLLKPVSGQILIDGIPLDQHLMQHWRGMIGYVPQDPFLLNNTIRENLLRFSPQANEAELKFALESASALEFIEKLPTGLDTVIGDRGVKLSGGERQRIVLARALLRSPEILVLDEATSALDTENEYKIQKAVEALRGKLTVIVIAHRLSTIQHADSIAVISNGRIVEEGTYAELEQKPKGYFKRMLRINDSIDV